MVIHDQNLSDRYHQNLIPGSSLHRLYDAIRGTDAPLHRKHDRGLQNCQHVWWAPIVILDFLILLARSRVALSKLARFVTGGLNDGCREAAGSADAASKCLYVNETLPFVSEITLWLLCTKVSCCTWC